MNSMERVSHAAMEESVRARFRRMSLPGPDFRSWSMKSIRIFSSGENRFSGTNRLERAKVEKFERNPKLKSQEDMMKDVVRLFHS